MLAWHDLVCLLGSTTLSVQQRELFQKVLAGTHKCLAGRLATTQEHAYGLWQFMGWVLMPHLARNAGHVLDSGNAVSTPIGKDVCMVSKKNRRFIITF
jgi:hypothetical protein